MAKITLSDTTSGYNRSTINANFSALEAELQNNVFYRNNPEGEPNQLENDLDMNSFDILNGGTADFVSITVNGTDLQTQVDAAEASATAAATSETNAANSFSEFQSIYYGALASEPTEDPNGNPPTEGDLYFNSTEDVLYVFEGGAFTKSGTTVTLREFTVAGVPSAADNKAGMIQVTDETGGYVPAFSDGTDWRRVTDRAIIS